MLIRELIILFVFTSKILGQQIPYGEPIYLEMKLSDKIHQIKMDVPSPFPKDLMQFLEPMKYKDNEIYHLIKSLKKVSGFLGPQGKPSPISEEEVRKIVGNMEESVANPSSSITFQVGEQVKVCDGPFASFNGSIEEIDEEKSRLKVSVDKQIQLLLLDQHLVKEELILWNFVKPLMTKLKI